MLLDLRLLYEDFPVLRTKNLSSFWAAPYTGAPWKDHDSAGTSATAGRSLVHTSGVPAATIGAAVGRRTSAYFTSTAVESIDPATLTMSGLWRASYAGAPWTGTASLGLSGSHPLNHISTDPSVGFAVNGFTPASYVAAASQQLVNLADSMSDLITISAYTVIALIKPASAFTATANIFDSPDIIGESNGVFGLVYDTNGITLYHDDGAYKTINKPMATGSYALVMTYYDGANLNLRVNNNAWATPVAAGSIVSLGTSILTGRDWSGANFLDASILELWTAQSALSRSTLDQLGAGIQAKYPSLSLGF